MLKLYIKAFGDLLLGRLDRASAPKTRCRQRTKSESWHPLLRLLILYREISTGPVDGAHAVHGADGGADEEGTEKKWMEQIYIYTRRWKTLDSKPRTRLLRNRS